MIHWMNNVEYVNHLIFPFKKLYTYVNMYLIMHKKAGKNHTQTVVMVSREWAFIFTL